MSKLVKEDCRVVSIYQLKRWGYLDKEYSFGSIIWTKSNGKENKVDFVLNPKEGYFELEYKIRNGPEEEYRSVKQRYSIVSTPCNYGGVRYWFLCSIYCRGVYCGKRVAKLYLNGGSDYFACRHCFNLSYEKRNENRRGKYGYLRKFFNLREEVEELEKEVKIKFRAGKPTKRYLRLMNKGRMLDNVCERSMDILDKVGICGKI